MQQRYHFLIGTRQKTGQQCAQLALISTLGEAHHVLKLLFVGHINSFVLG